MAKTPVQKAEQLIQTLRSSREQRNEIIGDNWQIVVPNTRLRTLKEFVEFHKIDLGVWDIERFVSTEKNIVDGVFYIKAFLKKRKNVLAIEREIQELKNTAKRIVPKSPKRVRTPSTDKSGNMLEINISDHHFGKLAWAVETGGKNYDTKIAEQMFREAFKAILARTYWHVFEEIWFVVGNDILNSDNAEGTTTKGTYVSTDVRYQKTFGVVRNLIIECIQDLRSITRRVKVILVPGNHDHLSTWHLGDSLECYFHKYADVEIDNTPKYYKFHSFGRAMIMFTHGDKGKKKNYPLLMATEQPAMFGNALFREIHTGHRHGYQVDEQHGIRVRVLSALCPPDAWHAENGFVGNLRSAEAFLWNKDEGLIGTVIYTDVEP